MQPFSITASGSSEEIGQRLTEATDAVADHAEADDATREELHQLGQVAQQLLDSPVFGEGVETYQVVVSGALGSSSSTSGGVDNLAVVATVITRSTQDQGSGQPTDQVGAPAVGASDVPPATPNQN